MPSRRILLVAPEPFFRATGTPINVLMMCRALTEQGFEVHVATLPYGEDVRLPRLVFHRTMRLPLVAEPPVGFSAAKFFYNLILAGTVLRLLARRRFAAVHAVEEAAFYAVPIARLFGVAAIADLDSDLCRQLRDHGSLAARLLVAPAGRLRRHALRHATGALTVAHYVSDIVRRESAETPTFEIHDIPIDSAIRPPDPARMAAYRAELDLDDRRLVVYTGNYDRRQGLEELVQAMPAVLDRHPDAALVVVGGHPRRIEALQALVDQEGIAKDVRLIGRRAPETMADYMGIATLLVSPRLEPFATPLKIFSYMASGRPIVATDLPTHNEVLDADTAILVPPTSAGLAAGIVAALDDPKRAARCAERARRLVAERHNYATFKQQLIEAYDTILGERPASGTADPVVKESLGHD